MTQVAAALLLAISLASAIWSFQGIVRRYRTLLGFPWLLSLAFAAASIIAVYSLHALLNR